MHELITMLCAPATFLEKGHCLPQKLWNYVRYSSESTAWFVGFRLRVDLIKLLLKMGPIFQKKWRNAIFKLAACRLGNWHLLRGEFVFGVKAQNVIGSPSKK